MKVEDHFLSKETFELKAISNGNILQTVPVPQDLARYYQSDDYLSHNKKKNLISSVYSFVQKLNLNFKLNVIASVTSSTSLFDYGCGDGAFLHFMYNKGYACAGFEPHLIKKYEAFNVVKKMDEVHAKYDIVTLWHVLEHIDDPKTVFETFKKILTDDGKLIIAIPNFKSYDATYYGSFWAGYDVPRHLYHYSREGAISFFEERGFEVEKVIGMPYDSYFVSMLSEKYKGGLIGKLRWAFIGLISNVKAANSGQWSSLIYVLKIKSGQ